MTNKSGFQTPYGKHERVTIAFPEASLTKQSFQEQCDVNNIMKRFEKTGVIDHVNKFRSSFGDFDQATDYHSAANQVLAAQESFGLLPSAVRTRFQNDAGAFLSFMQDEENLDEMVEMGLVKAPPPPEVQPDPEPAPAAPDPAEGS